jgi:hypothetical protein
VFRTVDLEDMSFYSKGGILPDTCVRFAPDGRLLAVGTFLGRILVVDVYSGETLWEKKVSEGMVKAVAFTADGATLVFGEQSVDSFIFGVDARTGEEHWRYRLADDIESSPPPPRDDRFAIYELPGCYDLRPLADGDMLALGVHSWGDWRNAGPMRRLSRVYRFAPDGTLRWAFPADGPLPKTLVVMDADPEGRRVAMLAAEDGLDAPEGSPYPPRSLYSLDGATGVFVGAHAFAPLEPHFTRVDVWRSLSVGPGGALASVGLYDGRSFLFDLGTLDARHVFDFGTPVTMGGIPVAASATYTHIGPDSTAYFQTGVSSVPQGSRENKVSALPGPHPNANTITAVGPDGAPVWRYRSGHHYQGFRTSADGRWLATCAEKDDPERGRDSGLILFDTRRPGGGSAKFVWHFQVEGQAFFNFDISPDGAALALPEAPALDPATSMLSGKYRIHVIR